MKHLFNVNLNRIGVFILSVLFSLSGYAEDYPDLHEILDSQIGNDVIDIPFGTYSLDLENKGTYTFRNLKDVMIKGNGSTVVCNFQKKAILFSGCENVVFSDLIIDYDPPCSTQGTITAINDNGRNLEVEIHEGYPMVDPLIAQGRVELYDNETRELIRNYTTTSIPSGSIEILGGRKLKFNINNISSEYKVGDFIVFDNTPAGFTAHTLELSACKNMKVEKITIYDSTCFSIIEHDSENNHYYRCVIDRKLNDPKYPQDRLRSAVADGIHSSFARKGPKVEECTIKYMGDDAIAMNGALYPVYKINEERKTIYILSKVTGINQLKMSADDGLVCINNNGSIRGRGVAERISAATNPTQAEVSECLGKFTNFVDKDKFTNGYSIKLSEWIEGVEAGDALYSNDRTGKGFEIINNDVGHNRSRGILVKASDGIVRGNTITSCAMSGIAVALEIYWMSSGLPCNLDINNNTIQDCMYNANMGSTPLPAALSVSCHAPNGRLGEVGSFENISIHRNIVKDCPMPCVFLNGIDGGYYYKNTIEPAGWTRNHGSGFLIPNTREYYEKNVRGIIKDQDPSGITKNTEEYKNSGILINESGYVSCPGNEEDNNLIVYDMSGREVLSDVFRYSSNVSVNSLEKGIYIINVGSEDKFYSRKYIVR